MSAPEMVLAGIMAVAIGVAAPVLFYLGGQGYFLGRMLLYGLGLAALSVNLMAAIGTAADLRESRSDPHRVQIERREALKTRYAELGDGVFRLKGVSQGDATVVILALVEKLKINPLYARSSQCNNVTKDDSSEVCDQIRSAEVRLGAARDIDRLEAERKDIWRELTHLEAAPTAADPQLDTLSALAGQVLTVDEKLLKAGLNGWFAIVLELVCTFMPAALAAHFARKTRQNIPVDNLAKVAEEPVMLTPVTVQPVRATSRKAKALPPPSPRIATEADMADWAKERLVARVGSKVQATFLQNDFAAWADAGSLVLPKAWKNQLSGVLTGLGYEKRKVTNMMYLDVALAGPALKVAG